MPGTLGVAVVLATAALGPFTSPAAAANWHWGPTALSKPGAEAEAARLYLQRQGPILGTNGLDFEAVRTHNWLGHRIVRLEQRFEGLPVYGRGAAVHFDRTGRLRTAVIFAAPHIDIVTRPLLSPGDAAGRAAEHWDLPGLLRAEVLLGIYDDDRRGILVWRVDGSVGLLRWRILVDALDGRVVSVRPLHQHATGVVYPENPARGATEVRTLQNLDAPEDALNGRVASVYHYVSGAIETQDLVTDQLATGDGTHFDHQPSLAQPAFDDAFAEVNAYYHAAEMDVYFRSFGFLPANLIQIVTNYAPGGVFENAFFTKVTQFSGMLAFGQGASVDYAYDGDVVAHEYTHYLIDDAVSLQTAGVIDVDERGLNPMPGALHEGLADYFAATQSGDPILGDYALGANARDLDNTNACPANVMGEPHLDGEIIGGTTWEIRTTIGATLADEVIFGGLLLLPGRATFQDLAAGITAAASALVGDGSMTPTEQAQVQGILDTRGLSTCGRELSLDGGAVRTASLFGMDVAGGLLGQTCADIRNIGSIFNTQVPGAFQYRIDVPAGTTALSFQVDMTPQPPEPNPDLQYELIVRRGSPVGYNVIPVAQGFSAPQVRDFDHRFGDFTTGSQTVTIDLNSTPPLQPGSTYYLAIGYLNCPTVTATVQARLSSDPLPDPDGGVGGPDAGTGGGKKKGCNCTAQPGGELPAFPLLLLGLFLALAWRRSRK